jgi:para-nitrobenzyl esterase
MNVVVKIDTGIIKGSASGSVLSFKGIPYAAPPINNYRWRAPQRVMPWTGVRETSAFGHDCMQVPESSDGAPPRAIVAEDCLVLNVWRPAAAVPSGKLPVLVWIHGGEYVVGGSSPAIFDGSGFARHGLVFVSINYRLGRFGFFAHPALIEANEGPVGNFALMDQIEALHWVKRNIAAFGGDPGRVTLMGESAGGISVLALLTSPKGRGLFQRAIVLSGGGRTFLLGGRKLTGGTPMEQSADQIGANFAKGVGIEGDGPQALGALRARSAEAILDELNTSTYVGGPIIDGRIVIAPPQVMLRRGEAARVPMIIGTTMQDLSAVLPPDSENPLSYFGADADKARAMYDPDGKLDPTQVRLAVGADMAMHEAARFVAKQMTRVGMPVWLYRFGYVAESIRPQHATAAHASELAFLFETLDVRYGERATEKDRAAAMAFRSYFLNFVKSGQPNSQGMPRWPKFDPVLSALMAFTPDNGPTAQPDPWKDRLDLVEHAADLHALGSNHDVKPSLR